MKGLRSLTNVDIDRYYADCPQYGGCFSKDYSLKCENSKFYVLNMDSAKGGGTHWILLWLIGDVGVYFDSFGSPPPEKVLKRMKELKKTNISNISIYQDLTSSLCGYYCLWMADELLSNANFSDTLDLLDQRNRSYNEKVIDTWSRKNKRVMKIIREI